MTDALKLAAEAREEAGYHTGTVRQKLADLLTDMASAIEQQHATIETQWEDRQGPLKQAEFQHAAGKVSPVVMVAACDMLIQCSAMVATPDAYIEWANKIAASKRKPAND